MPYPTPVVQIGTSVGSDSLVLDDTARGLLDTATLGDALGYVWSDITADVRANDGVTVNRGSTRSQGPYFRYEAGTAAFTLNNREGVYDPFNVGEYVSTSEGDAYGTATYGTDTYGGGPGTATVTTYGTAFYGTATYGTTPGGGGGTPSYTGGSPYTVAGRTLLRPGLPVRVQAEYQGVVYTLFVGFVNTWDVLYPEAGYDSVVQVTAYDAAGMLASADPNPSPEQGDGENAGERIDRVLNNVAWSDEARTIDTGTRDTLIPTTLAQPAWTEMLLAADSVNGYLFVDREGAPTFVAKSGFQRDAQLSFGVGGIPVRDLEVSSDADQVYNVVKLSRTDGTEQTLEDAVSRAENKLRGFSRSDLIVDTDDQVAVSTEYVLSQFKDWRLRVEGFQITPVEGDDTWIPLLRLDMLQRLSASFVTTDGRTVTQEGLTRGLTVQIRPFNWQWSVSTVQAPDPLGTFTLDDSILGVLSTGTLAAF